MKHCIYLKLKGDTYVLYNHVFFLPSNLDLVYCHISGMVIIGLIW